MGCKGVQGDELVIPSACGLDNLVESITNNWEREDIRGGGSVEVDLVGYITSYLQI